MMLSNMAIILGLHTNLFRVTQSLESIFQVISEVRVPGCLVIVWYCFLTVAPSVSTATLPSVLRFLGTKRAVLFGFL